MRLLGALGLIRTVGTDMKAKLGALALFACVGTPAFAACPDSGLQDVLNVYYETAKPNPDPASIISRTDAIVAQCPAEPYVLKAAAVTYATVKTQSVPESIANLSKSRALFRQMWDNLSGSSPARAVTGGAGERAMYGFDDLYNIEGQVRNLLWQAEQVSGQLADEDKPIGQGVQRPCHYSDGSDGQRAYFWINSKGDFAGAWNFLDRVIAACNPTVENKKNVDLLGYRARALYASANRAPTAPDAFDKIKRAKADAERFYAIHGRYSSTWLSESDSQRINALYLQIAFKTGAVPPNEKWFEAPNLTNPITATYIAMALDGAWAEDSKTGISSAYKTYRDVITKAYGRAQTSADPKAARTLLFDGAKSHASGKIRAPGNESLKAPPEFLYVWTDPNYVAPAPAATTQPAAPAAN